MGETLTWFLFHPFVQTFLLFLIGFFTSRIVVNWFILPLAKRRSPVVVEALKRRKSPWLFSIVVGIFFASITWFFVSQLLSSDLVKGIGNTTLSLLMMVYFCLWLVSLLDSSHDVYMTRPMSKQVPLYSYLQAVKTVLILVFVFVGMASLFHMDIAYIITLLGGSAAVITLVFKDPILSLVASLQVAANRMVSIGDWIEVPEFFANGKVLEINLTSVKIEGSDRAITTLPTYALISQSVKNWSATIQKKQRRFSRTIIIDINSIQLFDAEACSGLLQLPLANEIIHRRLQNSDVGQSAGFVPPSNLGLFLEYATAWMQRHPQVSQDLPAAAVQLPITANGLPVEVNAFLTEVNYPAFETLQSEILLHMLAVLPLFNLKVFQAPAGAGPN
jgi:miniconductance mechanosensitive channel